MYHQMRRKGAAMSKVFIGVFTGIFIGAVIYELLNRTNPEFINKLEDLANRKIDDLCDIQTKVSA